MRKTITKLPLNRETVRVLTARDLLDVGGAAKAQPSLQNTTSITYPSDAGGCESGNWSCLYVSCC